MRIIDYQAVVAAVRDLCCKAAFELPEDVINSLHNAMETEQAPQGKALLAQCLDNAAIASRERKPVCQDTGSAVFFIDIGSECVLSENTFTEAVNEGVRQGYTEGYLRASIVDDPLYSRVNTSDNTPALIHYDFIQGEALTITLLPKGGGSENISALRMLKPADGEVGIIDFVTETVVNAGGNPCPPVTVGVGIGGNADKTSFLAKKALLRETGLFNSDIRYRKLEEKLLTRINRSGNGPQGLGGLVTALAVHIETYPCHIASLPVAVALNCHAARKATITL